MQFFRLGRDTLGGRQYGLCSLETRQNAAKRGAAHDSFQAVALAAQSQLLRMQHPRHNPTQQHLRVALPRDYDSGIRNSGIRLLHKY